jgi:hypothetical protein
MACHLEVMEAKSGSHVHEWVPQPPSFLLARYVGPGSFEPPVDSRRVNSKPSNAKQKGSVDPGYHYPVLPQAAP